MQTPKKDNKYFEAKERVAMIKKFYTSLIFYTIFIIFFAGLNYYVNKLTHPWFLWAALGWGIGLFFQGYKAFRWNIGLGKGWEERKLKEFMDEEDNEKNNRWE